MGSMFSTPEKPEKTGNGLAVWFCGQLLATVSTSVKENSSSSGRIMDLILRAFGFLDVNSVFYPCRRRLEEKGGDLDSSFLYCKVRGRSEVKMLQLPRGDRPPARVQGRWEAHSWGVRELLLFSLEH